MARDLTVASEGSFLAAKDMVASPVVNRSPMTEEGIRRALRVSGPLVLGLYLAFAGVFLPSFLIALWPAIEAVKAGGTTEQSVSLFWGAFNVSLSPDTSYLMLVIVLAAIGSYVHAATSFVTYAGNRALKLSWFWWYLLRLFIGVTLALIFYFAVRGGFFAQETSPDKVNPYGIAALAGLTGLFSKQATDKLREVFDTLFQTKPGTGDQERADSLSQPAPTIEKLIPASVSVGSSALAVRIIGKDFKEGTTTARVNGDERETTYVGPNEVTMKLEAGDLAAAGELSVTVFNAPPGGGESESVQLSVT